MSNIENIKRQLKKPPQETLDEKDASASLDNYRRDIDNRGREEFYNLRKHWSWFILSCIAVLIIIQATVVFFLGFKLIDLSQYKNIALAFFIETFLQIVGLAYLVVQCLFQKS